MSAQQAPTMTFPVTQSQLQHLISQGLIQIPHNALPQNALPQNAMNVNANAQVTHNHPGSVTQAGASQSAPTQQPKKKRTLNCFVAFRCYISPVFDKFQQKDRSGFVKVMWAGENVKAKWTIIAKAYSTIRDEVGSDNAPMDAFLNLACPHIGIISRDNYLNTLGWELVNNGSGWQLIRRFIPDTASLPHGYLTTTVSVDDLVTFVRGRGYGIPAQTAASNTGSSNNAGAATLAMAAQPVQPAQTVFQPPQATQTMVQPAQPGSLVAHPVTDSALLSALQDLASSDDGNDGFHANLRTYANLADEELSQFMAVDPDPDTCTTSRFDFTEPVLYDRSINRELTGYYDIRPYYQSPDRRLKFVEIAPEKSGTMEFGEKAFQKLASDFWNLESEYPHDDQFIPGRHYTTFSDYGREIMPEFDAFDMHRLAHDWPADEHYEDLLSQNKG
uniref:Mating-type protein MAT-1 n=2 Tax=Diplodia sapinea TaxID=66738 RepID=V5NSF4_9PEZI|nr:MAT1-1-1 [Diplodia sapinea]